MSRKPPILTVLVDNREQNPWVFPEGVAREPATLTEGDYSTPILRDVARVERKSAQDFAQTITWGRERFDREIDRLQRLRWKCVIVEESMDAVWRMSLVHPHAVIGSIASLFARYDCPTFFCTNRAAAARLCVGLLRRWEEQVRAPLTAPSGENMRCVGEVPNAAE